MAKYVKEFQIDNGGYYMGETEYYNGSYSPCDGVGLYYYPRDYTIMYEKLGVTTENGMYLMINEKTAWSYLGFLKDGKRYGPNFRFERYNGFEYGNVNINTDYYKGFAFTVLKNGSWYIYELDSNGFFLGKVIRYSDGYITLEYTQSTNQSGTIAKSIYVGEKFKYPYPDSFMDLYRSGETILDQSGILDNGIRYVNGGQSYNNKLNGYGFIKWDDNTMYMGSYKSGVRQGIGGYRYQNGCFLGNFHENSRFGNGMYVFNDNSVFVGYQTPKKGKIGVGFTVYDDSIAIAKYTDNNVEGDFFYVELGMNTVYRKDNNGNIIERIPF